MLPQDVTSIVVASHRGLIISGLEHVVEEGVFVEWLAWVGADRRRVVLKHLLIFMLDQFLPTLEESCTVLAVEGPISQAKSSCCGWVDYRSWCATRV